jgi:hypothetical protein
MKYYILLFIIVLFTMWTMTEPMPMNRELSNQEDDSDLLKSFIHFISNKIQQNDHQYQV